MRPVRRDREFVPMTSIRRFTCHDLLHFNNINLDYFTETVRAGHRVTRTMRGAALRPAHAAHAAVSLPVLPPVPSSMAGVLPDG
jgi:hypothetical protein